MLRRLLVAVICCVFIGLAPGGPAAAKADILAVSFYEVLARPERFENRTIIVAGVLSLEFEDVSLYPEVGSFNTVW